MHINFIWIYSFINLYLSKNKIETPNRNSKQKIETLNSQQSLRNVLRNRFSKSHQIRNNYKHICVLTPLNIFIYVQRREYVWNEIIFLYLIQHSCLKYIKNNLLLQNRIPNLILYCFLRILNSIWTKSDE